MQEPSKNVDLLARGAIGAAIEVHRVLGPGFLEAVYEEALAIELRLRSIPFSRQHPLSLRYKGAVVGESRLDFLVGDGLVVELKAVETLLPIHRAQVISYLHTTQLPLGLLLNFKSILLRDGIQRIVLDPGS